MLSLFIFPMSYTHDSPAEERKAASAHRWMKLLYRSHNGLLLMTLAVIALAPKKDRADKVITTITGIICALGIWINGEAAQWHERAKQEHLSRL